MAPNINDTIERFLNLSCLVVNKQVSHGAYISQRAMLIDCLRQRWLGEKDEGFEVQRNESVRLEG
jgi:hypothetical protein